MKNKVKSIPIEDERRQAEAAKTSRLRALRLAKDAAEKAEAEARDVAAAASVKTSVKAPRRRSTTAPPASRSASA